MSFWDRFRKQPAALSVPIFDTFERRKREGMPQPKSPPSRFLIPLAQQSSWSLALLLAKTPAIPDDELRKVHDELTRRGKSSDSVAKMTSLAAWAIAIINPIDGRTAESGGTVHQIVADIDDLELALEVAAARGAPSAELDDKRALIHEHAD